MTMIFTQLVRWVFVILAIYILARSIRSLLQTKNPAEVWAYLHLETMVPQEDGRYESQEISVPLTHWENVIGRARSCDIAVGDGTISRNHGILMRDTAGRWTYRDLGSKNGSFLNDRQITEPMKPVPVEFGDEIRMGLTTCSLLPISLEEKNNNIKMRRTDTRPVSAGPTLAALTLFQILTAFQLVIALPEEATASVLTAFGGLILLMWGYVGVLRSLKQKAFEMDIIAFFLSTLSLAVVASSDRKSVV